MKTLARVIEYTLRTEEVNDLLFGGDVVEIGVLNSGQTLFQFRRKGDSHCSLGVMTENPPSGIEDIRKLQTIVTTH